MKSRKPKSLRGEKAASLRSLHLLKEQDGQAGLEASTLDQTEKTAVDLPGKIEEIENVLHREKTVSRGLKEVLHRFFTVQHLYERIGRSRNIDEIMDSLLSVAERVLPFRTAAIYLYDQTTGELLLRAERYLDDRCRSIIQSHFDEGIIAWVMSEKRAVIIPHLQDLTQDSSVPSTGFVIVPMLAANYKIGVLEIWHEAIPEIRGSMQLEMLELLAKQATIAIENNQLYGQLKHAHELLKKSQEQAIHAEKMAAVGVLASGIAHEINNPLQVVLSRIQLLKRRLQEEPFKSSLTSAEKEALRISHIVGSVLRYAQNQNQSQFQPCRINPMVMDALILAKAKLSLQGIKVKSDYAEDIPDLLLNTGEIEQVLLNLLENASHAMKSGGALSVRTCIRDRHVYIEIEDTGCGIPKEHLARIFEPFFTTKAPNEGAGLGLYVCYGIMERHRGSIRVESTVGVGTKFTLQLPLPG